MGLGSATRSIFLRRRAGPKNRRLRIFLWATLVSLIFGAIEFGKPVEDYLSRARNVVRQHDASGDILAVEIDDRSLKTIDKWPLPRRYHAQLTEELHRLGAKRIFFDIDFSSRSNPTEDRIFEKTLARLGHKVTLAAWYVINPVSGERVDLLPTPAFRKHTRQGTISIDYDHQGAIWKLPYALNLRGRPYPSLAASLARVEGEAGTNFPIDYSVHPDSVPSISAADVIGGTASRKDVAGKDVIIGTASVQIGDIYTAPGYGRIPGMYIQALGAETLKAGRPIDLGWLLPFLLSLLLTGSCLVFRNSWVAIGSLAGGIIGFLLVPLALDELLLFTDTVPALTLMLIVASSLSWSTFRQAYQVRGTTNPVSGLPNLEALRQGNIVPGKPLVAARIQNFPEITSTLPAHQEKALVAQIASRLTVGNADSTLYQGDEGIFAWFAEPDEAETLGDHLDALQALFRSPVIVSGNQVDLTVTFGVDGDSSRSLPNRLGSALVAADEAAVEGVRWKEYDSAKLKDAAWKLSLLSQLDAAIDGGDLWVAYQPKLDIASGKLVGAEALARWSHPEKGAISPMEFIPAAEQSDRIEKLTIHVLNRAIRAAAAINARGIDFEIAVNLSARLIDRTALVDTITDLLGSHRLPAERLTLEVTETAALATTSSLATLDKLRELGVQISIDDYGTGLSTLDYLKKIPATEIKIDRSFVHAMAKSQSDRLMVNSTIQLAHSLGQTVVAEGVEDSETLEALAKMGCDTAQGYLIARPMPFRDLMRHLTEERQRHAA